MTEFNRATPAERLQIASRWLDALAAMLGRRDFAGVAGLIHTDGYWRDLLTFGWEFVNRHGHAEIAGWLGENFETNPATNFRIEGEPFVGALGEHKVTLEFFYAFDTAVASGRGFVRLVPGSSESGNPQAFTILTAMKELKGAPERVGRQRFRDDVSVSAFERENWLDRRRAAADFSTRDPEVLVIGGGQSGLMAAARLQQIGVRTLIVDKSKRLGDIWRKRYRSLKLHNEICMNHFPYLHFPENWPVYIPKDKLADWFEFYATSMELNVWMETTFLGGAYDDAARHWIVRLQLCDGSIREMRPRHLVMALGVSGIPNVPDIEGIETFRGPVFHSSGESDDLAVKNKSVLVVGAGTSAHDIAQDMYLRGANVTMLQRSPVTVVSLEPSSVRPYEIYRRNEGIRPLNDTDLMASSIPYSLTMRLHVGLARQMTQDDAELLSGLQKAGFLVDNYDDETGYFIKLLRYQAGYYLDVGCSRLIIDGKIKIRAGTEIARINGDEILLKDGTPLHADVIVFGTGYRPLQDAVRNLLGDEIADRVGPIWGIDDDYELCAMYGRTGQEGFFVNGGGFMGARVYSPYTAMLIKADLMGILPRRRKKPPRADHTANKLEHAHR